MSKKLVLIDNFDSFTYNLVDYFEQANCKIEVFRNDVKPIDIDFNEYKMIVLSPGPSIPKEAGSLMDIIDSAVKVNIPVFGVCLGHEAIIEYFGGSLKYSDPYHGKKSTIQHDEKNIFKNLDQNIEVGRYHSLVMDKKPSCLVETAKTADGLNMGLRHESLQIESVQFHPESILTMKNNNGLKMVKNMVQCFIKD